jgi:hypothetical protein
MSIKLTAISLYRFGLCLVLSLPWLSFAQESPVAPVQGKLRGNFQMIWQQYNEDSLIGAIVPAPKTALNAFGNFQYTYGKFTAGVRFESYMDAILGYSAQNRFKGTGIGFRFAQYKTEELDITVGNFYEQFGMGLTLRSYWEPFLGIDNALDGVRIIFTPFKGATIKALYGQQRLAFDSKLVNADAIIRGVDGEFSLNELVRPWSEKKTRISLGGSFVSKFQDGGILEKDSLLLQLPQNVSTYALRAQISRGPLRLVGEYSSKINDPSADNDYIYKRGQGIFITANYSRKGFGVSGAVKSIDNMSFRADRNLKLFDVPINYMPAITRQHTYNLAATLYPYATPFTGEVSFMGEVFYAFKKESILGGKYGTQLSVNFAAANNLDSTRLAGNDALINGYRVNGPGFGKEKYVRDFNIELKKKVSKDLSLAFTYYYLEFNTKVTPVTNDFKGLLFADIEVVEINYKLNPKNNLHLELQALQTRQDKGDWATIVAEYTYSPHWTFAVLDQYNYGNGNPDKQLHYLFGTIGYVNGGNRIAVGYGKRRQGVFCIGGVCRAVPATNGFELTATSSF